MRCGALNNASTPASGPLTLCCGCCLRHPFSRQVLMDMQARHTHVGAFGVNHPALMWNRLSHVRCRVWMACKPRSASGSGSGSTGQSSRGSPSSRCPQTCAACAQACLRGSCKVWLLPSHLLPPFPRTGVRREDRRVHCSGHGRCDIAATPGWPISLSMQTCHARRCDRRTLPRATARRLPAKAAAAGRAARRAGHAQPGMSESAFGERHGVARHHALPIHGGGLRRPPPADTLLARCWRLCAHGHAASRDACAACSSNPDRDALFKFLCASPVAVEHSSPRAPSLYSPAAAACCARWQPCRATARARASRALRPRRRRSWTRCWRRTTTAL
jgi:hypothetical protein